ncbi:BRCA1 C Terminus (BRCT) domain [Rhizoctonia solani]|uniref:BRCA1 C Terminus (BRCT) domain n=1 Tax=Rhizoctonia solani TaxID=456999 RepID=A0A8H7IGW6_9AGAM|nr:BRCA1 C Terminus (BRCT) domain [Rhizoctonia solani]
MASPPKLTNFGFNVGNKPKHGRALFHLSPSPRAKAKRSRVFASPNASRRKSKGGANTSAETSRTEITVGEDNSEEEQLEPNNSIGASVEHEFDDQAAPLPHTFPYGPLKVLGLRFVRRSKAGLVSIIPTLQSLSKRPHATPVPLFAATPRRLHTHHPLISGNELNAPSSPSKPNTVPIFAPTPSRALAVPSTPAHKSRTMPIFTPNLHRGEEESPTKKPPPVFAPTKNLFASLPLLSAAVPATVIPETPTTKGRSLPTFTPKMLFPPSNVEDAEEKGLAHRVSKPPVFGSVLEDEESTPRANRQPKQTSGQDALTNKVETKLVEMPVSEQVEQPETAPVEQEPANISVVDLFNNAVVEFTPQSKRILTEEQGFFAPSDSGPNVSRALSPMSVPRHHNLSTIPRVLSPCPKLNNSLFTARVTRSRSRSESVSVSDSVTRCGSVGPQGWNVSLFPGLNLRLFRQNPRQRLGTNSFFQSPEEALLRRNAPDRRRSSRDPGSCNNPVFSSTISHTTSHRPAGTIRSQVPITITYKFRTKLPLSFLNPDSMDPETSPLSSLPDDIGFSFVDGGDTTAGDTTMRDMGDTTVCPDPDGDTSMQPRDSIISPNSPPVSPPAPTSPVSSLPASPTKQPPSSSNLLSPKKTVNLRISWYRSLILLRQRHSQHAWRGLLDVNEPVPTATTSTSTETRDSMIPSETLWDPRTSKTTDSRQAQDTICNSNRKSGIPTPGPSKIRAVATTSTPAGSSALMSAVASASTLGLGKPTTASRSNLAARTRAIPPLTVPAGSNPSPRKGQSKDDSDLPGTRRSMISQDTQASLSSLSSALEKLARPSFGSSRPGLPPPRHVDGLRAPSTTGIITGPMAKTASASAAKGKGKAKDETSDDMEYEESNRSANMNLTGRLGNAFIEMLRLMGAKIVSRPTPSTTHIVFKSGHQSTLTKYKLYDDPKPFLIGIGWVVQCAERQERLDEERFRIRTDEVSALDLKKRRKAELPHQMQFMARDPNPSGPRFGSMSVEASAISRSLEASAAEVMQDAELAAERGRQRSHQRSNPPDRDRSPS